MTDSRSFHKLICPDCSHAPVPARARDARLNHSTRGLRPPGISNDLHKQNAGDIMNVGLAQGRGTALKRQPQDRSHTPFAGHLLQVLHTRASQDDLEIWLDLKMEISEAREG